MIQEEEKYYSFIRELVLSYYPVSEKSLSELFSIAGVRHLHKGELLLPVGSISKEIYMLYQGSITAYFIDEEGNSYHKNIFLEGDMVGSTVSRLKEQPSEFALEAIEDSTIISFFYKTYRQLIEENDELKNFYIAYLEKNWVIDKEKREIDIVMKDAGERYSELIGGHPGIDSRIPLHLIASHLGITPTQLSRIRKNFKKSSPTQHM